MRDANRARSIYLATFVAIAGMEIHNVLELGLPFLLWAENVIPVLVYVGLAVALVRLPTSRFVASAALLWALANLVLGGVVSVLPLPFLPFVPEQTLSHYGAHVIYAVSQVPLVLVSLAALRERRSETQPT